jgi:uncharacterized surface protein with fasciclin (FAS1) repeats
MGPYNEPLNYTHMFDFTDYRNDGKKKPCFEKGSIYEYLYNSGKFTKFLMIIERADMIGQLGDLEANFTLLCPDDESLKKLNCDFFNNMDIGMAKQILNSSLLNRKIGKNLLTSSPVSYYYTKNPIFRLYVTNINSRIIINECLTVKQFDIKLNNNMIHVIDGLIIPDEKHFMN